MKLVVQLLRKSREEFCFPGGKGENDVLSRHLDGKTMFKAWVGWQTKMIVAFVILSLSYI